MLKEIGKSMYRTKYSIEGCIPFASIDLTNLKFGDVIRDNDGKGMFMYVNEYICCQTKYLAGTLILVPERCKECILERAGYRNNYYE